MKPENKKAHLIGIAGAGMSALAVLLKEAGWRITGSDRDFYEPTAGYLKKHKIKVNSTHRPDNIPKDVQLVVIGKHAGLAAENNPETRAAIRRGLIIKSLPEMLAFLSEKKESLVVTGSFGKSTLTALLAWCLVKAKRDPSYFIGAIPLDLKNSSHLGRGREFVLEGDEYPSANWDKTSKFLHLAPTAIILTSAEHDHVNIFPTAKAYREPYKKLVAKIPRNGFLVYSVDGKNTAEIAGYSRGKNISYSLKNKKALWYAKNMKYGKVTTFDLIRKGKRVTKIQTKLLGKHNIENIVGAGALLLESKKITPGTFARAVKSFHGIKRRIELKNADGTIPVYEGFGSSYGKTRAIFETLKLHFPKKRIVAVFEPHAFSWRNKKFLHWYKNIFAGVDEVIVLPAASRGKKDKLELSTKDIWQEAKKYKKIHTAVSEKAALGILQKLLKPNDVVALVSSGPMLGLTKSVPRMLAAAPPYRQNGF